MRLTAHLLNSAPSATRKALNYIVSSRYRKFANRPPTEKDVDDYIKPTFRMPETTTQPLEGLLAINKPTGISSAEALRRLQQIFKRSSIFAETLNAEKQRREAENRHQPWRKKQNKKNAVKIGHGGTLDPMASGVLIAGIGAGTKRLQDFLNCTKTYEAVAMFGAGTDTYDSEGKVTNWAKWEDITKEKIEEALGQFRGDILQKPPIYSALHMNGKRLYEYAREGKPLPVEIKARPVSTLSLELVDFTHEHDYKYPEDAPQEEKDTVAALEKQLEGEKGESSIVAATRSPEVGEKRPRSASAQGGDESTTKKQKTDEDAAIPAAETETTPATVKTEAATPAVDTEAFKKPCIATFRLTVTSGFYVRSFIHDIGKALGSEAHMVKLVRTRQADFELGNDNVLEWRELMDQPEEVWGPKVEGMLRKWAQEQKK